MVELNKIFIKNNQVQLCGVWRPMYLDHEAGIEYGRLIYLAKCHMSIVHAAKNVLVSL